MNDVNSIERLQARRAELLADIAGLREKRGQQQAAGNKLRAEFKAGCRDAALGKTVDLMSIERAIAQCDAALLGFDQLIPEHETALAPIEQEISRLREAEAEARDKATLGQLEEESRLAKKGRLTAERAFEQSIVVEREADKRLRDFKDQIEHAKRNQLPRTAIFAPGCGPDRPSRFPR